MKITPSENSLRFSVNGLLFELISIPGFFFFIHLYVFFFIFCYFCRGTRIRKLDNFTPNYPILYCSLWEIRKHSFYFNKKKRHCNLCRKATSIYFLRFPFSFSSSSSSTCSSSSFSFFFFFFECFLIVFFFNVEIQMGKCI